MVSPVTQTNAGSRCGTWRGSWVSGLEQRAAEDGLDRLARARAQIVHIASALKRDHQQLAQATDDDDRGVHPERGDPELGLSLAPGLDEADEHLGEALERGQAAV